MATQATLERRFIHFNRDQLIVIGRGSLAVTADALATNRSSGIKSGGRHGPREMWPVIDDDLAFERGKAVVALGEAACGVKP